MDENLISAAIEMLKESGVDYTCIVSDKRQIALFSNLAIKELTVLFYAMATQNSDFKSALQAAYYQLQKDKDIQCPIITKTIKGIN